MRILRTVLRRTPVILTAIATMIIAWAALQSPANPQAALAMQSFPINGHTFCVLTIATVGNVPISKIEMRLPSPGRVDEVKVLHGLFEVLEPGNLDFVHLEIGRVNVGSSVAIYWSAKSCVGEADVIFELR